MKTYSFYQTFNGSLKKVLVISADPFNWDGDPETLAIVKNIMAENGLYLTHYDDLQKLPDLFKGSNITCIADAILVKATWDEEKHPRDHGRFAGKSAGQAHAILTTENSGHIDRLKSHIQHEGAKGGHDWSHVGNQHHIATKLDELDFEGKRPIPTTSRLDPESAHKDLARHNVAQLDTLAAHNAHVAQTPDAHWGHVGSAEHINRSLADLNDFAHGEGEYADTVPAHGGPDIEDNKPHPKEPTRASTEAKQDRKAWDDQAYQPLPKSEPKAAGPLAGKGKMKRFQHGPAAQGAAAAAPAASKPQAGTFQAYKEAKTPVPDASQEHQKPIGEGWSQQPGASTVMHTKKAGMNTSYVEHPSRPGGEFKVTNVSQVNEDGTIKPTKYEETKHSTREAAYAHAEKHLNSGAQPAAPASAPKAAAHAAKPKTPQIAPLVGSSPMGFKQTPAPAAKPAANPAAAPTYKHTSSTDYGKTTHRYVSASGKRGATVSENEDGSAYVYYDGSPQKAQTSKAMAHQLAIQHVNGGAAPAPAKAPAPAPKAAAPKAAAPKAAAKNPKADAVLRGGDMESMFG